MSISEKLAQIAQNEPLVYEAGKEMRDAEWWKTYMTNLKALPYANKYAFAGVGWTDETFNPTVSLTPIVAEGMFFQNKIVNYKAILERNNVTIDFGKATTVSRLFYYSYITDFPMIDLSSTTSALEYTFGYLQGENITLPIVLKADGSSAFTHTFYNAPGLKHLMIEGGIIGQNGFDVRWSKGLSKESITSIIGALSDQTSGLTVTLSKQAVNTAFENENEWKSLLATKLNWTISLV